MQTQALWMFSQKCMHHEMVRDRCLPGTRVLACALAMMRPAASHHQPQPVQRAARHGGH